MVFSVVVLKIWVLQLTKWVPGSHQVYVDSHGYGDTFVWVKSNSITYVNCYFTPNERINIFSARMNGLEDAMQETKRDIIVAGDFSAKALE